MLILQITATLNLLVWVPIIAGIVSIMVGIATIWRVRHENKEKMATKSYVLGKVSAIDLSVINLSIIVDKNKTDLEKTINEHKSDNVREHEDIRKEFTSLVGAINSKIDTVIKLMPKQ